MRDTAMVKGERERKEKNGKAGKADVCACVLSDVGKGWKGPGVLAATRNRNNARTARAGAAETVSYRSSFDAARRVSSPRVGLQALSA